MQISELVALSVAALPPRCCTRDHPPFTNLQRNSSTQFCSSVFGDLVFRICGLTKSTTHQMCCLFWKLWYPIWSANTEWLWTACTMCCAFRNSGNTKYTIANYKNAEVILLNRAIVSRCVMSPMPMSMPKMRNNYKFVDAKCRILFYQGWVQ